MNIQYALYNKTIQYAQGVALVHAFCEHNDLQQPLIKDITTHSLCGSYSPRKSCININKNRCRAFSNSPYQWSYPGYTADLSVIGVIAHELGHHWHWLYCDGSWGTLSRRYRAEVRSFERPITSYGNHNSSEGIAEAFKLFVTNPTLLLAVAPVHYLFFHQRGLRPIVTRAWHEILDRSPRHIDAAISKARRAHHVLKRIS